MSSQPSIDKVTLERYSSPIGIGHPRPSISWRFVQDRNTVANFSQRAYELKLSRSGKPASVHHVVSNANVAVPWPSSEPSLVSRERLRISVRATGDEYLSAWTPWFDLDVEAALLEASDWSASFVGPNVKQDPALPKRPWYTRTSFNVTGGELSALEKNGGFARVYATALGVYQLEVNGNRVEDARGSHVLAPGWQSYKHRLHYQIYDIPAAWLRVGSNVVGGVVGEGWYAGHLTWREGWRNIFGEDLGVCIQLELGVNHTISTCEDDWEWAFGPLLSSEIYVGETFDASLVDAAWSSPGPFGSSKWSWAPVNRVPTPRNTVLIAPEAPPIRRIEELKVVEVITSPSGKTLLDFGQNLVGWVKIKNIPAGLSLSIRCAEVLEHGELGVRPLRGATATDHVKPGAVALTDFEPLFTFHGFRYAQITGWEDNFDPNNFTAVIVHTAMERLGDFECSHHMITQLHKNVVWGLRGNFVGIPSDCPQRDERMGWTGDIQVVTATASFLYDTSGFLGNWLDDLVVEQLKDNDGIVNMVVPNVLQYLGPPNPQALWADVVTLAPSTLYKMYGDRRILDETFESMVAWMERGIPRDPVSGLWLQTPETAQLGDWLDPTAPPESPSEAMTDPFLVANAYLVYCTGILSTVAGILNKTDLVERYTKEAEKLKIQFQLEYTSANGRLVSDSQTALCLALHFDLLPVESRGHALNRLVFLIRTRGFKISTGFAGTAIILQVLAANDKLALAYRLLQEKQCPSWLYPVSMGATTVWERWDSMLPDGSINPGEMTSFNHYALGSVAEFLHSTVGGLSPLEPGWKRILVRPQPGGTVTSAKSHHISPYGMISCEWVVVGGHLQVELQVPPNATASVVLPGETSEVGSGQHSFKVKWQGDEAWPPKVIQPFMARRLKDEFAA